jgi:hypothetical protein
VKAIQIPAESTHAEFVTLQLMSNSITDYLYSVEAVVTVQLVGYDEGSEVRNVIWWLRRDLLVMLVDLGRERSCKHKLKCLSR